MSEVIDAHLRHLRAANAAETTIVSRVRILRKLHEELPFGLLFATTPDLVWWMQHEASWAAWTRATYAKHIRSFYRWACPTYSIDDPTIGLPKPRNPKGVPNPVTDEELAIAVACPLEPWRTAVYLAAYGGLRASEICRVRREHVTPETIYIEQAKGGDPESVDTHPLIWDLVKARGRGPLLVRPSCGRPPTSSWMGTFAGRHFDRIGLPGVTMHRFRHWFGTMLMEQGADIRTVQELMRHQSLTSTQGYTLVRGRQRRLAISTLPAPTQPPSER